MSDEEVLIIGAGPYGLSVSAFLHHLGIEHRVVGRPLDTWRSHMPPGMKLRSEPYGSDLASPRSGYDVRAYCESHGLEYVHRLGPLSIERFLDYGDWFIKELVPPVMDLTVTEVSATAAGFRVSFADAAPVNAGQVVVATGVLPYAAIPAELAALPSGLVSHTSAHGDLTGFRGRRVAVIGAGQSALETAALLHEAGAQPVLVAREPALNWLEPNPARLGPLGHLRRPVNKLCEGWHCAFWNSPTAFRMLPQELRVTKARTVLGPAGAWWLKDRVEGVVEVLAGHRLTAAQPHGNGVRLLLDGSQRSSLDVDHVVAGTGFRVDVATLPFLPAQLLGRINTVAGYPVVNRVGESSVPGLYFAGVLAAASLGPSVRFIAGTHNTSRGLARSLARGAGRPARAGSGTPG